MPYDLLLRSATPAISNSRSSDGPRNYSLRATNSKRNSGGARGAARTQELDNSRETLEFALDAAGMASWDLDLHTDTARRSSKHDRLFGYSQELPTWGFRQFLCHVIPEERDRVTQAFEDAVVSGGVDVDCRIVRADGDTRWISAKGK